MRRLPRRLALWGGAAAIASGGFAFMATNTVAATNSGVGATTISGYTVHTVHYNEVSNALVPGGFYIQGLIMKLSPNNAKEATVWFENTSGTYTSGYYNCTQLTATDVGIKTEFSFVNTPAGWWSCGSTSYGGQVSTLNGKSWVASQTANQLHVAATQ